MHDITTQIHLKLQIYSFIEIIFNFPDKSFSVHSRLTSLPLRRIQLLEEKSNYGNNNRNKNNKINTKSNDHNSEILAVHSVYTNRIIEVLNNAGFW